MQAPDQQLPPAVCALGVTGRRLRRALPLRQPSPALRDALRRSLVGGRPPATDDALPTRRPAAEHRSPAIDH